MNGFEQAIKTYLDNRAKEDALFAQTYKKANKSIEECCKYIIQEVRKTGRQGFADEEIFGMAIHYYDEDNIKVEGNTPSCKVVHNKATQEKFKDDKPKANPTPKAKVVKPYENHTHRGPVDPFAEPKSNVPNLFEQPKAQPQATKPQTKAQKKKQALQDQLSLF